MPATANATARHPWDLLNLFGSVGGLFNGIATGLNTQNLCDLIASLCTRNTVGPITAGPYTQQRTDEFLRLDPTAGAFTVDLLTSSAFPLGTEIVLKNVGTSTNAITIAANGSDLIDGAATATINSSRGRLRLAANGAGWDVI